jgi:hypothetical protein
MYPMPDGAEPLHGDDRQPSSGDAISRLVSADARAALEQLNASLLSEGKVCLLGLESIRQRLGAKWYSRRERIYDHVQQSLRKQIGAHGFFLRVSETDYLVAQPAVGRLAGQAYCLNCLRDVLTHFLGEALLTDIAVHQVNSIQGGRIAARYLDPEEVEAEAEKAETARKSEADARSTTAKARPTPTIISQDRWTPFVAKDGRSLRASCQLEPVFQLKTYGRIGYRMRRRVLQMPQETPLSLAEQRKLTASDMERIDFATLARGLNRIHQEADQERQPSLILPVSYMTLSSQRGRAVLAEFFRVAQDDVQQGLICEVCDIEGVPPSALLAATSLIRPFCVFIVGRLGAAPQASLKAYKDAGLQGISIECPPNLDSDDGFSAFAKQVVGAVRPAIKGAVLLYGVAGPHQAAIASLCGATHASFAPAKPNVHYVDDSAPAPA